VKRHPCLADGCPEAVPGSYLFCLRHWALVPAELRAELRRGQATRAGMARTLVRVVAWLNSRVELDGVPPPGDHRPEGVLWACGCRSCAGAVEAAALMRGVPELAWIGEWWRTGEAAARDLRAPSGPPRDSA
jgi:hypothetical protein